MKKYAYLILLCIPLLLKAQQKNLPLNVQAMRSLENDLSWQEGMPYHTGVKPLLESDLYGYNLQGNSGVFYRNDSIKRTWLARKVKHENLVVLKDSASRLMVTIDPLFNLEGGKDMNVDTGRYYQNTRGILVRGDIGKRFSFESSFYENQAFFVNYVDCFVRANEVVPGSGRVKAFKTTGFDYAAASGYISWSLGHFFNLQLGHGKHFIGDGYRSLLLSDNAFNYPYAKGTMTIRRLRFTNMIASLQQIDNGRIYVTTLNEPIFQKKIATFHHLSYLLGSRSEIGLFQSTMWNVRKGYTPRFRSGYINPLIFSSAFQNGLSGNNNVMLGANLRISFTPSLTFYSQYVLDDVDDSKISTHKKNGYQLGLKYYNALNIRGLYLQLEYNDVRAFTYTHRKELQNYTHYNQSLAHPLGANFTETVGIVSYRVFDFFAELKFNYAVLGADSASKVYGGNVLLPDDHAGVLTGKRQEGFRTQLQTTQLSVGYVINRAMNMQLLGGVSMRTWQNSFQQSLTNYVYVGFRTALSNTYFDF